MLQSEVEEGSGFLVVRLKGDMRLWGRPEVEQSLLDRFRSVVTDATHQVVLSLGGITSLDTMGIATLVRLLIQCTKRKIGLRVVMPSGVAGESLRRVRIFDAWPTYPDEPAAVRAASA